MSAELNPTRLTLKGDKTLPRQLVLTLGDGQFTAQAFAPEPYPNYRSIGFAYHPFKGCRMDARVEVNDCLFYTVWVGDACFDVTAQEAAEIHSTFAPLGLRSPFVP